ncbi:MAG: adenine phosphoribosyltransferase [Chloroflexota bacterium]|nr:adenine phosphoribosyltransferase [Chloroflexota bacterium]
MVKRKRIISKIRDVKDFPKPGIGFKDITPILEDSKTFRHTVLLMSSWVSERRTEVVVGIESRGFIFGAPIALEVDAGFVPVRKQGKLPRETIAVEAPNEYALEYFEVHAEDIKPGQRVVIVDDLLATGGSLISAIGLVQKLGGEVVGVVVVVELCFLGGMAKIKAAYPDIEVFTLVQYDEE